MVEYLIPVVWIAIGLVGLLVGGEVLVRGASALAIAARISPLVVGLTVVAYGTSSPELAVGVQSSISGQAGIVVGNVVGSSICNVLLILGISAMVAPLAVESRLIRFDVPLMVAVSMVLLVMAFDGRISRTEGLLLFAGAILYTGWTVAFARREAAAVKSQLAQLVPGNHRTRGRNAVVQLGLIVVGIVLLAVGSQWLVGGSTDIARLLGVSDLVIGLTIVAVGTSLPELVTSAVAAYHGAREIAVGNVVGSNIFNVLLVLGLSAAVSPVGIAVVPSAIRFDIPVMVVVSLACLPVFFAGSRITRWEGGLLFAYYVVYLAIIVLDAVGVPAVHTLTAAMVWFFMPLTAITLGVSVLQHIRSSRRSTEQ